MKKNKITLILLTAFLLLLTPSASVHARESQTETEDVTLAPYFIVENTDSSVDCFPLKETDVTANISGTIAEIYVVQTYTNEGNTPINASMFFLPLQRSRFTV